MIDSIPLSEVKSIDRFQEALNNANHHVEEDESTANQYQGLLASKKAIASMEHKQGSNPETPFESDSAMRPSSIAVQAAGMESELGARVLTSKVMQIKTDREGHNSGRTYYIRANESDDFGQMVATLSTLAKHARKRAENKSRFQRNQLKVRRLYNSRPFQYFTAILIFGVVMTLHFSLTRPCPF